ncbi:Brix domain-containing protein [Diplonema papillatum]|nr:Brix domain-containing protein [Diplonema papillatum]
MLRKYARMRKEYLSSKGEDRKRAFIHDRKQQLKEALDSKQQIPNHLKTFARGDKNRLELDDEETGAVPKTHIDDEYALAGVEDPKVLVTTAHNPSQKLTTFAKEMRLIVPNSQRMNRGSAGVPEIIEQARTAQFTDVIFLHEQRGEPSELVVSHLPLGPTVHFGLHGTVMRHDIEGCGAMSQQTPHLVLENFTTKLGERIQGALKFLFPVPRKDSQRVISFDNQADYVSFRQHTFTKKGKDVTLTEVGPRFELRPFKIVLGTADMKEAEVEWQLAPYTNTAKKRRLL